MDKAARNERIGAILHTLTESPNKIFTLGHFVEMFGSAKSTISEDLDVVQSILDRYAYGRIDTLPGAAGGVRYLPVPGPEQRARMVQNICDKLSSREHILPGGFLYTLDLIYHPETVSQIASLFAARFAEAGVDAVVTVETKGIPLAFMTARFLNVPLVIAKHYSEVTDGAAVSINYVSGSSRKIQTMALSIKSLRRGSRIIFIDDFMKGGGTARGIMELSKAFECDLVGIGVLVATREPERKLVEDYFSIVTLESVDELGGKITLNPSVF